MEERILNFLDRYDTLLLLGALSLFGVSFVITIGLTLAFIIQCLK
jgi:hypothetical protein